MIAYSKEEIEKLAHISKINLVNSATGYKPANLIGTKSKNGTSNLAIFSSITHYGSSPAIYGFVMRPTTVARHTYDNIKETGVFTINSISVNDVVDAHHTSAKYPKEVSEFEMTKFTEQYRDEFYAPFVTNAPIQLAMKFVKEYAIEINDTILLLGEVQTIYIRESIIEEDLFINLGKAKIAAINGLDGYVIPKNHQRLPYQRPKS